MGRGGVSKQAQDVTNSLVGCMTELIMLPFRLIWAILTFPFKGRKR